MNQANKPGDELRQRLPAKQHFWCSVVVLDLGEQELSPSKLQFPDRLFLGGRLRTLARRQASRQSGKRRRTGGLGGGRAGGRARRWAHARVRTP